MCLGLNGQEHFRYAISVNASIFLLMSEEYAWLVDATRNDGKEKKEAFHLNNLLRALIAHFSKSVRQSHFCLKGANLPAK